MSETTEVDVSSELLKKAREMEERALAGKPQSKGKKSDSSAPKPSELSLNLYPEDNRANSNFILRRAIFGVIAKRPRAAGKAISTKASKLSTALVTPSEPKPIQPRFFYNEADMPGPDTRYRMTYTGEALDQADRDVYELLIYLCKTQPLGTTCIFSAHHFLQLLGRNVNYAWLEAGFKRLLKASIAVYERMDEGAEKRFFGGHLVDFLAKDEETKKWAIRLGPEIYDFYTGGAGFTYYPSKHRLALKKHPLASWLQGYFCTHVQPIPVSVADLMRYSGSESKSPRSFKQTVDAACIKLTELGIFLSWGWQGKGANAKLFVCPQMNKSQAAYLNRKTPQKVTEKQSPAA